MAKIQQKTSNKSFFMHTSEYKSITKLHKNVTELHL